MSGVEALARALRAAAGYRPDDSEVVAPLILAALSPAERLAIAGITVQTLSSAWLNVMTDGHALSDQLGAGRLEYLVRVAGLVMPKVLAALGDPT